MSIKIEKTEKLGKVCAQIIAEMVSKKQHSG